MDFCTLGEPHGLTGITHDRLGQGEQVEYHAHRCLAPNSVHREVGVLHPQQAAWEVCEQAGALAENRSTALIVP